MTELRKQINNIVEDHQACLTLAKSMNGTEVYEGTTATAEDIMAGKTAYSNGEKIIGVLQDSPMLQFVNNLTHLNFQAMVTSINLSKVNLSNCMNFYPGFGGYKQLQEVHGINAPKCTSVSYMFNDCENLRVVPLMNIPNVCSGSYMFQNCYNLVDATHLSNLLLDNTTYAFRNCYNLTTYPNCNHDYNDRCYGMFANCWNLVDVSFFNTALIYNDGMRYMFQSCPNLSVYSLNNILGMCAAAKKVTSYKTLAGLGLSSSQASVCTGLSNYQAFIDAGWTTGY